MDGIVANGNSERVELEGGEGRSKEQPRERHWLEIVGGNLVPRPTSALFS